MIPKTIAQLFDLKGQTALVTGGAMGIGKGIAERLGEAGANVVIADINPEQGQKTLSELKSRSVKSAFVPVDIRKTADIENAVNFTVKTFGGLDILVNNAGIFPFMPVLNLTEDFWDKVLDTNLKSAFFFSQKAAKIMVEKKKGGRIINIASIDALHPTGNLVAYDSSKGGMVMMTKAIALELGKSGITVNAIAPGGIQTPGAQQSAATMMQAAGLKPEDFEAMGKAFTARIPLGRQGDPDDIATVALFLASDASRYITGETIVVDGGYLLS
jgi:2-dehydro-3-deoxy-D-gluconate 5-dehydrogenase